MDFWWVRSPPANFVPVNAADDILHLLLGIAMIGLGVALSRGRTGHRGLSNTLC